MNSNWMEGASFKTGKSRIGKMKIGIAISAIVGGSLVNNFYCFVPSSSVSNNMLCSVMKFREVNIYFNGGNKLGAWLFACDVFTICNGWGARINIHTAAAKIKTRYNHGALRVVKPLTETVGRCLAARICFISSFIKIHPQNDDTKWERDAV